AADHVMVVIAGEEHEPLALQPQTHQREQSFRGFERFALRAEQQVEHVPEEDHLVDIEVWLEQRQVVRIAEDVLPCPGAEMGVRDDERAHRPGARSDWDGGRQFAGFSAWPPNCLRIADRTWLAKWSRWRDPNRENSALVSTGAGTPSSIAATAVQR